jgi:hypothetical protein
LATKTHAPEHDPSGRGCAIAGMANRDDYRGLRGGWSPTDICELCAEPGAIDRARAAYAAWRRSSMEIPQSAPVPATRADDRTLAVRTRGGQE